MYRLSLPDRRGRGFPFNSQTSLGENFSIRNGEGKGKETFFENRYFHLFFLSTSIEPYVDKSYV